MKWTTPFSSGRKKYPLFFRALVLWLIFILLQLAGWKRYTTLISGTSTNSQPIQVFDLFAMLCYLASYLGATVLAPILALATGMKIILKYLGMHEKDDLVKLDHR